MSTYYRVLVDSAITDLWFLGEPVDPVGGVVDARRFTVCERFGKLDYPLRLPIKRAGRAGRLTLAAFDMPVVEPELGASLAAVAGEDLELLPAKAEDGTDLTIANVLQCVDCIDESRTTGNKWAAEDGRPDKTGTYRTIVHLFLDPSRINHDIFRVRGWKIALIVSSKLAEAAGLRSIEGLRLQQVT